jgi:hypothetical protein
MFESELISRINFGIFVSKSLSWEIKWPRTRCIGTTYILIKHLLCQHKQLQDSLPQKQNLGQQEL